MKKLLENKLIKYNNTSSNQMYIGQLQQFYYDFKYVTVLVHTDPERGIFRYTLFKLPFPSTLHTHKISSLSHTTLHTHRISSLSHTTLHTHKISSLSHTTLHTHRISSLSHTTLHTHRISSLSLLVSWLVISPYGEYFSYCLTKHRNIIKMRGLFEIPLRDELENDLKEFSSFEKELRQIFNEITSYTRNLIEGKLNSQRIRINIENGNFSYYEIKHKKLNEINEIEDLINKYEKELNQIKPKFNELINKLNNMKINSEQTIQNYLNKY
ncbi:uncharacterized protein TA20355 [Theileria annulata]|uniref:Uncharacterized protein n=1 Tax=Theileria annulata TaxID=5874 RepID=Q4UH86_THEAN|nr:uncharacterized protein TA20355 [Theileria annulata]CAI73553.1 hypothetical protein TA20355 [Theileria annulata]|eukprot:XP_954230.1 hypothetical protein TA20355 [Theileria annulata]